MPPPFMILSSRGENRTENRGMRRDVKEEREEKDDRTE